MSCGGASQEIADRGVKPDGISKLLSTSLAGVDPLVIPQDIAFKIPIGIPRVPWDTQPSSYTITNPLVLGTNSTFLNRLIEAGQIPSRVWLIFWGRMWTDEGAVNGSVVLGGYDNNKIVGNNFPKALDFSQETGCWTGMKITVSSLLVNFRNGTDANALAPNTALTLCIVPHERLLLDIPFDMVTTVMVLMEMNSTGPSYGIHYTSLGH